MYFSGLTKCFLCNKSEMLSATRVSNWRALKTENKIYYLCPDCLPKEFSFSKDVWKEFYASVIKMIYDTDFKRPIRNITLLRDIGGNPRIEVRFK